MQELDDHDAIRIDGYYEGIYKKVNDAFETFYEPRSDIPLRTNYLKTKKDYLNMILGIIDEQNAEVGWCTMLAVLTGTKMFVRRYNRHNPLFASMICLEMWIVFEKLSVLWRSPTNSHRVRLEERHIDSLMQADG